MRKICVKFGTKYSNETKYSICWTEVQQETEVERETASCSSRENSSSSSGMSTRKVMVLLRLSCGLFTVNPLEGCKIPKLIPDATNTPLINKTKDKTTGHWISLGYPMPNRWLIDVCVRNIVRFLDYRCVRNIVCFLEWRWELGDDLHDCLGKYKALAVVRYGSSVGWLTGWWGGILLSNTRNLQIFF